MDPIQSKGRLDAAVSFDIPGMGFRDPETGKIEGFEADLVRAIAGKYPGPCAVEFHQAIDDARIEALQDGRVDIVASQLTITPARQEEIDFSDPYIVTGEALLVRKGSGITCFEDLKGKRIAVTQGSVSILRMQASLPSLPGAKLVITALSEGNLEALAKGEADAASNDMINLRLLQRSSDDPDSYEIVDIRDRFPAKPFGIGVKKGNQELVEFLNRALEQLKAEHKIEPMLDAAIASVRPGSAHPVEMPQHQAPQG